jgi:hypothetical protein
VSIVSPVLSLAFFEVVLAIHIMAAVIAFGVTFAYPIMFAVAGKHDPKSLPVLHRIEYSIERWLVNPGLAVVLVAGIYLASDLHQWSAFYVQWGLGAAIVIGALVGSVMIPTAKRAEAVATRDIAQDVQGSGNMSEEYQALVKRLSTIGTLLSLLVLATIFLMATKAAG